MGVTHIFVQPVFPIFSRLRSKPQQLLENFHREIRKRSHNVPSNLRNHGRTYASTGSISDTSFQKLLQHESALLNTDTSCTRLVHQLGHMPVLKRMKDSRY